MGATAGAGAAFQAGNSVGGGYIQAAAMRDQGDYGKKLAELENKGLDYQADRANDAAADARKRGGVAANNRETATRLQVGAVRAAASAEGGTGSAAEQDATGEVESMSAADQAAIKTNAFREAFGLQSQAIALKGQEDVNTFEARGKANALEYMAKSSMITGWSKGVGFGLSAAADFKKGSGGKGSSAGKAGSGGYAGSDSGSYGGMA